MLTLSHHLPHPDPITGSQTGKMGHLEVVTANFCLCRKCGEGCSVQALGWAPGSHTLARLFSLERLMFLSEPQVVHSLTGEPPSSNQRVVLCFFVFPRVLHRGLVCISSDFTGAQVGEQCVQQGRHRALAWLLPIGDRQNSF